MGERIVHVLGRYVASQCKIYELYQHTTYFVILGDLNFSSIKSIGFRHNG